MTKKIVQVGVPLAVAGALMWLLLRGVDGAELMALARQTHLGWLLASLVAMMGAHVARAERWRLLLEPLGDKPTSGEALGAVLAGYAANLAVPRLGEVTRCGLLYRRRGIPVEVSLGTVIAERAFDVLMLLLITGLSLVVQFGPLARFFGGLIEGANRPGPEGLASIGLYLLAFVVGLAAIAYFLRKRITRLPFWAALAKVAVGLVGGLLSVARVRNRSLFVLTTLGIWVGYYLATYLCLIALPGLEGLPPLAGLMILTVGSYGMIAPVQGGIGAYHFMIMAGLTQLYNAPEALGKAAALIMHGSQNGLCLILGLIAIGWLTTSSRRVDRSGPGALAATPRAGTATTAGHRPL